MSAVDLAKHPSCENGKAITIKQGSHMNWDTIEGNWKQMKGSIKEKWGKLTDNELDMIEGKKERLVGKIQEKYGIAKEEANKQLDAFQATAKAIADKIK